MNEPCIAWLVMNYLILNFNFNILYTGEDQLAILQYRRSQSIKLHHLDS